MARHKRHLTPEQQAEVERIEDLLMAKARLEVRNMARLSTSKENRDRSKENRDRGVPNPVFASGPARRRGKAPSGSALEAAVDFIEQAGSIRAARAAMDWIEPIRGL